MMVAHMDQVVVFGKDPTVFDMETMGNRRPPMLVVGNQHFSPNPE
jgi:hypothetical protein